MTPTDDAHFIALRLQGEALAAIVQCLSIPCTSQTKGHCRSAVHNIGSMSI
jgi:hypothetical protein